MTLKRFLNAAFGLVQVSRIDPLERPLLDFSDGGLWCVHNAHRGTLILGSQHSGKTTGGRTILSSMIGAGFGGVVSVVKNDLPEDVREAAKAAGRERDIVTLRAGGPERFDPFCACPGPLDAAALLSEIADSQIDGEVRMGDGDWRRQRDTLLQNLCVACHAAHGKITFDRLRALYREIPGTRAETDGIVFRKSLSGELYHKAKEGALPYSETQAVLSLYEDFPAMPDKTQGSIRAMIVPVFQVFTLPALSAVFSGEPTVDIGDALNHRKILLADIPESREEQRAANAVLVYCLCKGAQSLPRKTDAFLFCDEFHETVGPVLIRSLSLLRQFRVAPVLISQSLPVIEYRTGRVGRDAILGLVATVFCFEQNDVATREWAEKYVGDETVIKRTKNRHDGKTSFSETEEERPKLNRNRLSRMKPGHCFRLSRGNWWRARWSRKIPKGPTPLRIKG